MLVSRKEGLSFLVLLFKQRREEKKTTFWFCLFVSRMVCFKNKKGCLFQEPLAACFKNRELLVSRTAQRNGAVLFFSSSACFKNRSKKMVRFFERFLKQAALFFLFLKQTILETNKQNQNVVFFSSKTSSALLFSSLL